MTWPPRRKGVALTFYVLFSLVPKLMLVLASASLIFDEDFVRDAILSQTRFIEMSPGIYAGSRNATTVCSARCCDALFLLLDIKAFLRHPAVAAIGVPLIKSHPDGHLDTCCNVLVVPVGGR